MKRWIKSHTGESPNLPPFYTAVCHDSLLYNTVVSRDSPLYYAAERDRNEHEHEHDCDVNRNMNMNINRKQEHDYEHEHEHERERKYEREHERKT